MEGVVVVTGGREVVEVERVVDDNAGVVVAEVVATGVVVTGGREVVVATAVVVTGGRELVVAAVLETPGRGPSWKMIMLTGMNEGPSTGKEYVSECTFQMISSVSKPSSNDLEDLYKNSQVFPGGE